MIKQKGFTLIELLIVIAIIGIISAFLFVNFVGVRQRGRDSQRKSDLKQIQTALELYRADLKSYPTTANFPSCGNALVSGSSTYMQKVPCDPISGNYTYSSDSSTYSVISCLENLNDGDKDTNDSCVAADRVSFTVQNP